MKAFHGRKEMIKVVMHKSRDRDFKFKRKEKEFDFVQPRKRYCRFCVEKVKEIDYKDSKRIEKAINDRAKIYPRKLSGVCAKHQRKLQAAVKLARYMALMPYVR